MVDSDLETQNGPRARSRTRARKPGTVLLCPLCKSDRCRPVYRLGQYQIARCVSCDVLFNSAFRGGGEEGETFDQNYFLNVHSSAFASHVEDYRRDPSVPVFDRRLDFIESRVPRGRLLDVGPGLGTFLCVARDRGWEVAGLDISQFNVTHIREKHGIDMFRGNLHEYPAEQGAFDLITFWDSIEHVSRPRLDLEHAYRLLRPGGLVLLATDNYDCLVASLATAIYRLSFGKVAYPMKRVFIDRNATYFTERVFARLIAEVGFEKILFEKMEYPLDKISLSRLERAALRVIYAAAALTGRHAQFTVVARKP